MPTTITAYYSFAPATKARSSQVNTNFSNYRGDLLPINENTASASDLTHHLGGSDHRWATAYINALDFKSSTTTAGLVIQGQTSNTTGAWEFKINGVTAGVIAPSGLNSAGLEASARTIIAVTYTANGSFTVPAGLTHIKALVVGGGGAGANAPATNDGGPGGGGAICIEQYMVVSAGDVLSIVCGSGGAAYAGGLTTGAANPGTDSYILRGGSISLYGPGALGGYGLVQNTNTVGVNSWRGLWETYVYESYTVSNKSKFTFQPQYEGGMGTSHLTGSPTAGTTIASGQPSPFFVGGSGGVVGGRNAGGGGGSSYGQGGKGGDGTTGASTLRNGSNGGYGAGGGGAAPSISAGTVAGNGGNGIVIIYYTKTT